MFCTLPSNVMMSSIWLKFYRPLGHSSHLDPLEFELAAAEFGGVNWQERCLELQLELHRSRHQATRVRDMLRDKVCSLFRCIQRVHFSETLINLFFMLDDRYFFGATTSFYQINLIVTPHKLFVIFLMKTDKNLSFIMTILMHRQHYI